MTLCVRFCSECEIKKEKNKSYLLFQNCIEAKEKNCKFKSSDGIRCAREHIEKI